MVVKQDYSKLNVNQLGRNLTGHTDLVGFYLSPNNQKYLPKLFLQFTENCFYFRIPIFVH